MIEDSSGLQIVVLEFLQLHAKVRVVFVVEFEPEKGGLLVACGGRVQNANIPGNKLDLGHLVCTERAWMFALAKSEADKSTLVAVVHTDVAHS